MSSSLQLSGRFFGSVLALATATACGGTTAATSSDGGPAGSADAAVGDAAGAVDSTAPSPDAGVDAGSDAAVPPSSDASTSCGTGSTASSTSAPCGFTAAFSGATTAADGALTVTLANTQAAACTPQGEGTTQAVTLQFPPATAVGTFTIVAPDAAEPAAGEVTVSYEFFSLSGGGGGGGSSNAQAGTVTLTAVGPKSAEGSFQATFAGTACGSGSLALTGTFGATACACP